MYIRKSWHDSRHRLALYAVACLAVGVIVGLDNFSWFRVFQAWRALSTHAHDWPWNPDSIWESTTYQFFEFMPVVGLWSGLALGATSVGREYGSGGMSFVLTRPQSRWRVVWHEWALAIAEICLVLYMFYVGALPILLYATKHYVGFDATLIMGVLAVAACLCGLTQFLTLLTGSSMKGLSAAIAVILFYYFLPSALAVWWHIQWPEKLQELSFSVLNPWWNRDQFSILEVTGIWMLVALIFPFLSQWLIERREV